MEQESRCWGVRDRAALGRWRWRADWSHGMFFWPLPAIRTDICCSKEVRNLQLRLQESEEKNREYESRLEDLTTRGRGSRGSRGPRRGQMDKTNLEDEVANAARKYCLLVSPFIPTGVLSTPENMINDLTDSEKWLLSSYRDMLPEDLKPHYHEKEVVRTVCHFVFLSSSIY